MYDLTQKECKIFDVLIEAEGIPLTAEEIFDRAYGAYPHLGKNRLIRTHICNIRSKFGKGSIVNYRGRGYVAGVVG